jgi:NAD(P)-dependent dehydrogenase (short-subunit alcohol dehydrogenase family)
MEIDGIAALVTGGSSGLGRATAQALAERGARVLVADLAEGEAREGIEFERVDICDEDQVRQAVERANADGRLRVCVNCAGIGTAARTVGRDGPHDLGEFRRIVEVNLIGTFNVIRLAADAIQHNDLLGEERGVIVNTASVAAFEGQIGQVAYSASKGGIAGITLPVARDLAKLAIRCVTIAPGLFDTSLFATVTPEMRAALEASVPHPSRLGKPDEFASLALQIVANPMLNGDVLRLDGALRMGPR